MSEEEEINTNQIENIIVHFNDYTHLAQQIMNIQPIMYDTSKIWWIWENDKYKWTRTDDTQIMILVDRAVNGTGLNTSASVTKGQIIECMKKAGRIHSMNIKQIIPSWIQFGKTIVDARTGNIFKATSEYFVCNPLPWNIGRTKDTPILDKLFKEWVVKEDIQDETYITTLYEVIAYCCLSEQFLQRIIAFTGAGSNGKGVFQKILKKFLGGYNICGTDIKALSEGGFNVAQTYKKLAILMGEVNSGDLKNTNTLKSITGESDLVYIFKGKDGFTDTSYAVPVISTNALPTTPDRSDGFYRRWHIIDFPNVFKVGRDILGEIPDEEFENLALKSIEIAMKLYRDKTFTNEGTLIERREKYEAKSNPVSKFLMDECIETSDIHYRFSDFKKDLDIYLKKQRLRSIPTKILKELLSNEGYCISSAYTMDENGKKVHTTCVLNIINKRNEKLIEKENELINESFGFPVGFVG